MGKFLKWGLRVLVVLLLAVIAIGLWQREQLMRLWAVNSLFSEEKIVSNFSNMQGAFLATPVSRGDGPVSELPLGEPVTLPEPANDWITARNITSLVVLRQGEIVFEDYYLGTGPDDQRISWSIAKSYLSALFGVLLSEGAIGSIDDPVTQYAPSLAGSAYDGATIKDVLQMSSGVVFDEDYLDYDSDINRMGRVLALGGSMDEFAAGLSETFTAPGTDWQYVSIDTHVIGMVIRGATGRSVAELLSEKIIAPLGLEEAPYYLTDGFGVAFVLGGLNMRTRDFARFGQMIAQDGQWNGQQVVPGGWIDASTVASAPTDAGQSGYGYQWWIPEGSDTGQVVAQGVYGQYIWIDRARNVVIASTAADRQFRDPGVSRRNIDMFRLIADSLFE